jgi:uncharacterized protein with HEPN domain
MDNAIKKLLFDILQSIERIDKYTESPKQFTFFASNLLLQQAVERNFEIMGEAMNRILKLAPDIAISHSRKIVDTRNKIVHGYDEIEPENLWNIIINYLPTLKTEVELLLKD